MKLITTIILLLGVSGISFGEGGKEKYGDLVFSYLTVRGALSDKVLPKTGIEFYIREEGGENPGSLLTVIEYRYGTEPRVDSIWDAGNTFLQRLKQIKFRHFDFESECEDAIDQRREDEERRGLPLSFTVSLDGFFYSMHFAYGEIESTIEGWNIDSDISFHSEYSEDISKLRHLIELFGLQFAKMRLGM